MKKIVLRSVKLSQVKRHLGDKIEEVHNKIEALKMSDYVRILWGCGTDVEREGVLISFICSDCNIPKTFFDSLYIIEE